MGWFSAIAVFFVCTLTAIYIYFKHKFNYWKQRGIPHQTPHFPWGNIKDFGRKYHQSILTKRIYDQFKGVAPFCGVYILAGRVAMITDLDLLKHILVKDFQAFSDKGLYTNEVDEPLMSNLFFVDGEKWRLMRTKLTPTFTSGKMKFMFPTVVAVAEQLKFHLFDVMQSKGDVVEIKDVLVRFTTDVIGTCAFGIDCNSLNDPNAEFKRMGQKAFQPKYPAAIQMAINGLRDWARKLHVRVLQSDVSEFFLNVVEETVEYRRKNNVQRNDFLDILMKLNDTNGNDGGLTIKEMAAQVFLFFLAGFETSSSTLQFCLYELAINPEIQTKARKVIQDAFKKHGQFTYEMMMDMPYIDHILQETLRLYPPISVIVRYAKWDYQVPGTKHVIEKGTNILIPNYAIQHDADYYPNPEKFDPHRFDSDEMHKRNPMSWLPFGEGPRNCIGLRFGMMQARIGLVTLLNNFEFSLSPKTVQPIQFIPHSFILVPKDGVYLKLKKLHKNK